MLPAELTFGPRGPHAPRFGDSYCGEAGAAAQAQGVFLAGCGLPDAWRERPHFSILETGFGLGFNFLAAWDAWRKNPGQCARLHFLSIERHPVTLLDLARAHAAEPAFAPLARRLRRALPAALAGCHRMEFEHGQVLLTLVYGDGATALRELSASVDAIFLDGFAPTRNPDMWSTEVLIEVARLAAPGARLATWCASGELRRQLLQLGFSVVRGPAFLGKRETTRALWRPVQAPGNGRTAVPEDIPTDPRTAGREDIATKPDSITPSASASGRRPFAATCPAPDAPESPSVMILGAGLAGCALAERLARRGWQITLLDAASGPAQGASGNPAGVVRPLLSRDDNRVSQLTRAAFLYAVGCWSDGPVDGARAAWHPSGVLQLARDPAQFVQWQASLAELDFPSEFVWLMDAATARRRTGLALDTGGLLFPQAGWAEPGRLCQAALAAAGTRLLTRWNAAVAQVLTDAPHARWRAVDAGGSTLAQADHVVFATGAGLGQLDHRNHQDHQGDSNGSDFLPAGTRPLQSLRGEITEVQGAALTPLDLVVCSEGYLSPGPQGKFTLGATYDPHGDEHPSPAGIAENLARLHTLSALAAAQVEVRGGRAAWRSIAPDRVPLVGADPLQAGCWHLRALASRGLVWSPLLAETLACEMNGEPLPMARSLRAILAPDRPLLRPRIRHDSDPTSRLRRQPAP